MSRLIEITATCACGKQIKSVFEIQLLSNDCEEGNINCEACGSPHAFSFCLNLENDTLVLDTENAEIEDAEDLKVTEIKSVTLLKQEHDRLCAYAEAWMRLKIPENITNLIQEIYYCHNPNSGVISHADARAIEQILRQLVSLDKEAQDKLDKIGVKNTTDESKVHGSHHRIEQERENQTKEEQSIDELTVKVIRAKDLAPGMFLAVPCASSRDNGNSWALVYKEIKLVTRGEYFSRDGSVTPGVVVTLSGSKDRTFKPNAFVTVGMSEEQD